MRKIFLISALLFANTAFSQKKNNFDVIAYYTGNAAKIDSFEIHKLSHIIFSFCHLKNGEIFVQNQQDSLTIKHLVSLKKNFPNLKIMLSLGGWGGCEPCSEVFSTKQGREKFANSFKKANDYFKTDGIDLDWEYPTIEGFPGHLFQKADKNNFTELIKSLRKTLGSSTEISFAAGGFQSYLDESVDWHAIMPLLNRVNIMSYDLVNGYSKITGHHTPLFSTKAKEESTDNAVKYLLKLGIPAKKLVIGGAFYTRIWKNVEDLQNGLYQAGEHISGVDFRNYAKVFTKDKGWEYHWDEKAKAAFWYNPNEKKFATGDDGKSIIAKTQYAKKLRLGGIMFWELTSDLKRNGLLDAIFGSPKALNHRFN